MGKETVLKTLRHEKTDEVAWVPFTGVHAAFMKGYTATDILTDGDKLFDALMNVHKLYSPDGMPIVFDLQIEAEILGCKLFWADENPPSVVKHPLRKTKEVPCKCKIPKATDGRIPMVIETAKRVKEAIGDDTALYGLICGPVTLASHLRGTDFFMDIISDPEYVKELVNFCAEVNMAMAQYYIDAGMDVIAVVDPLISQVSPKAIEAHFLEPFQAIFDYIRNQDALSCMFVCGDATNQMDVMARCHADGISIDENVDIKKAKEITDKYNVTICGNIPLTTVMLFGSQLDNMKYVVDMMDNIDHHNLIISPGCDMPFKIPVDNTIACVQAIKHTDESREMVKNHESAGALMDIELPDYDNLTKPFVELFTLDAETCAACTYMVNAVMEVHADMSDLFDVAEYKYCIKEDIARTQKMGVEHLPSIYINGKCRWSSIIPAREELIAAIKELA
ncbi:uroporphyrinogen decarboxylase family protein [Eubacteriaceae bacterium ES3]|nr:uroporphyrinogen decarboxylase family protein [Eubacteriaceae bacterium ES3]